MEFRGVFIANPARLSLKRGQLVVTQDREITIQHSITAMQFCVAQ